MKFLSLSDKQAVWEARSNLKPKEDEQQQFRLIMDKPKSTKERESMAFRIVHEAQRSNRYRSAKFQNGKIWIDGEMYEQDELDRLPDDLLPTSIASPRTAAAVVFFSRHSYLSNHNLCHFVYEGRMYTSIEQFLTRARALFAKNYWVAEKTLQTDDPQELKRLLVRMSTDGRREEWRANVGAYIKPALRAKFLQNEKARKFLVETGDRTIGEASIDRFWGIGMSLSDHRVFNVNLWGNNFMGKALMELRDELK